MNNGVAGGANRNEVMDWINFVTTSDRCDWYDVMNMNKAISNLAESLSEVYTAHLTSMAMMGNASGTCQGITFISIHNDFPFGTFGKSRRD